MQKMLRESRQNYIGGVIYSVYHCKPIIGAKINLSYLYMYPNKRKIPAEPHQRNIYLFTDPETESFKQKVDLKKQNRTFLPER
jgi:hypothetical protein